MSDPAEFPDRRRLPIRPSFIAVAVVALLAAIPGRLLLNSVLERDHDPLTDVSLALNKGPRVPPVNQQAAATCLKASPAVDAVRSEGTDVLVRFVGQPEFMKLQFFADDNAAIRASYAHGSPNGNYNNTVWSNVPTTLTKAESNALGTCLPMPREPAVTRGAVALPR